MVRSINSPQVCGLLWVTEGYSAAASEQRVTGTADRKPRRCVLAFGYYFKVNSKTRDAGKSYSSYVYSGICMFPLLFSPSQQPCHSWFFGWKERCNEEEGGLEEGWVLALQPCNAESNICTYLLILSPQSRHHLCFLSHFLSNAAN